MKRIEVALDAEQNYADSSSVGSSPRSIGAGKGSITEVSLAPKWDDKAFSRVKLMCSYGGKILPRPHDNQLRYIGGETRIVVVNRNVSYAELVGKLSRLFGSSLIVKYQLPTEDLDALISVTSDEDLENMMEESDKLQACNRPSRLRLFLFPTKLDSQNSLSDLLENNRNRENWFVEALNGLPIVSSKARSETSSIVSELPDYLFGLDAMEEWAARSHHTARSTDLLGATNSQGEKLSAMRLSSLLHGSGDISSAPGSPMNSTAIGPGQSASSAPPSISSMTSAVVDAILSSNPLKPTTQIQMEPTAFVAPVQKKDSFFEKRGTDENFTTNGASNKIRNQPSSEAFKGNPVQRFLTDDISAKITKPEQQGTESSVISQLQSKPLTGLETASNIEQMNDQSTKIQSQEALQSAHTDIMNQDKFKTADNPQPNDLLESNHEGTGYTRILAQALEMKQETEVQKMPQPVQGGDRPVKRPSEERVAEMIVEQLRKSKDHNAVRQQGESREISQGNERQLDHSNSSDVHGAQHQMEEISAPWPPPPNKAPFEAFEIPQGDSSQQLKQETLYSQFRDVHLEADDPASTYATQSPTLHQQMSLPTGPPNSSPPMIKSGSPSRLSPSQSPKVHPRMTSPTTTPMYSEGMSFGPEPAIVPPPSQVAHLPRQTSDPVQHFQRVSIPYNDHPVAHALPSRFRGRPIYQTPAPDMKRVVIARPAQAVAPHSRTPVAPPQHNDQSNYTMAPQAAYVDPNTIYANYGLHGSPHANPHSTGVNPFADDCMVRISPDQAVSGKRYQDVMYDHASQELYSRIDGPQQQGRQYVLRS
eukprot:c25807_g1_i1 orf=479-2935(+)